MAVSSHNSRERLLAAAVDLLRRRGLRAASVRELARHAKAPLGSTYHYFPAGKQQWVGEAMQLAESWVNTQLADALQAGPRAGVAAFLAYWQQVLAESAFRAGCPVMAVSVEAAEEDGAELMLDAAARAMDTWQATLARALQAHGQTEMQAGQLATLVVAAVEGGIVLCRAKRSLAPLLVVQAQLDGMLAQALGSPEAMVTQLPGDAGGA